MTFVSVYKNLFLLTKVSFKIRVNQLICFTRKIFLGGNINISSMNIEFWPDRKLEDVQKDFNGAFPFLKLEFAIANKNNNSTEAARVLSNIENLTIGDLNKNIHPGLIEITESMTVFELEKIFTHKIEMPVRVLRKSGNIWMGTSITNNWTLSQQNEHGREISTPRLV